MSIASRDESSPLDLRLVLPRKPVATRPWISPSKQRVPAIAATNAHPGADGPPVCGTRTVSTSASPSPRISNRPISCVEPNRFFTPRTTRTAEWRSPSNDRTTSTRCSSSFGPASAPSLVTWPTTITPQPVDFARPTRSRQQRRSCAIEPGAALRSARCTSWIESTRTSVGRERRACSTMRAMLPSPMTRSRSPSFAAPPAFTIGSRRSARRRTCCGLSSLDA